MTVSESHFREIRTRIAQCIQELPALPVVVSRVLEESQKENVTATTLEKLIGSDQALAAKTLRVVNSAYYGMSKKIDSLSQAVVILGMQQIRNLVLSVSAMGLLSGQTPKQKQAHRNHWMHALATASAALTLARKKRIPSHEQEVAFIAGLLHDIGRLFLFTNFTEAYCAIDERARAGERLEWVEKQELGLTHSQVGQVLGHVWNFPDRICALMGEHEGPFTEDSNTLGLIVHISHQIADHLLWNPHALEAIDPVALAWMSDLEEEMFQIKNEVEAKIYAYEMLFGLLAA